MASGSSMLLVSRSSEDRVVQEQEIRDRGSSAADVPPKKQRNRPGMPYPDAEVIALSPTTLMAKNRFVCEICYKGFPREQNLQLHKRGHNLPWTLKQRSTKDEVKRKVYLCPDPSCVHHEPSRALGDLTGIKKHYSRKHGDKKYKCQNCEKMYAVQSDLKAHFKTCGKKEYKCHCGTLFSRRDNFISHRAFCEALAEGGLIRHRSSTTSISSPKSTDNNNYPSLMSATLPKSGSKVPSIQNLTHTIPAGVSQIGQTSHTIRPSDGFNCYKPIPSFFVPSADHYKYQGNSGIGFFTNLVNSTQQNNMDHYNLNFMETSRNNGYLGSSFSSSYAVSMPQFSANGLLQKANFAPTSCSSDPVDGTMFENGRFCFGNPDSNEHSIVESTIFSRFSGATYGQEDSNHGGQDGTSREYDQHEWKGWNSEELRQQPPQNNGGNMSFRQSSGVAFTRDFLGVGGEMVGNISSDIQQCTFGGQGFL